MLLVENFSSLTKFWSDQLHLRKLNGVLAWRLLTCPWIFPTSPAPSAPRSLNEKAEVVEHLDTCDGTKDHTAMILLSVMSKLRIISTTATSLMITPCSFCPKIFKEKAEVIEPMEVHRYKHISNLSFQCVFFIKKPL